MPNSVHIIIVPSNEEGLRRTFADGQQSYTRHINARIKVTGHLWQGRIDFVVMDEGPLANAVRHVSLNRVRAGLVMRAQDWKWSSVAAQMRGRDGQLATIKMLAPEAFAVALLGLIEAVSISRSIASKSHQRINGNQEFIGQGLSNMVGSFFSSYAGSGSFTRSGINYSSGAKSPVSAIFAAIFLMMIILLIAPLAAYLPVAAMGGVIMLVAYNLIDFEQIKHVLESSKAETAILLTTFFATLFLELEFAIYLGVLLSLVIFLARTSNPEIITLAPDLDQRYNKHTLTDVETKPLPECPRLKVLRIDMSIYFGSVNHIQSKIYEITEKERIYDILIIGEGINLIDLSGAEMLLHEAERLEEKGGGLYFACLKPQVYYAISRTHLINQIGNNHFFDDKGEAVTKLQRLVRMQGRCEGCTKRVFKECGEGV